MKYIQGPTVVTTALPDMSWMHCYAARVTITFETVFLLNKEEGKGILTVW